MSQTRKAAGGRGPHVARKRFGQHFLSDAAIIDAIVRAIDPRPGQPMSRSAPAWPR